MVELIAQEENDKKCRCRGREEGNCNHAKINSACVEMSSVRLHSVQVAPSGALSDGISHVVNKDGKDSSAEAHP